MEQGQEEPGQVPADDTLIKGTEGLLKGSAWWLWKAEEALYLLTRKDPSTFYQRQG